MNFNQYLKHNILIKLGIIGVLILLLLLLNTELTSLIKERENVQAEVSTEVGQKWGRGQTIIGPYLAVPYYSYAADSSKNHDWIYLLPESLKVNGDVDPQKRQRGIYELVVYEAELKLEGLFDPKTVAELGIPNDQIEWDKASLNIGISDMKGIQEQIELEWDGEVLAFEAGLADRRDKGVNATLPLILPEDKSLSFSFNLALKGSQHLYFTPVGKTTKLALSSSWDTPSFSGEYLPDKREVTADGFNAEWTILNLNRNYPQQWLGDQYKFTSHQFGTDLILPINNYQKTYRVSRYAILFLSLTFMVFFFVEVLQKVFIHPIQYLLVGLALVIFYALLLSFGEHLAFNIAYMLAAVLTIILITSYTAAIIKSLRVGALLSSILLLLYGFIFIIILQADYALMLGSIAMFLILALVMFISRKIDWYELNLAVQPKVGKD